MNAHANVSMEKTLQSLTAKCRDGRHKVLQLFAELEKALADLSGEIPVASTAGSSRTFGNKLRAAIKEKPALKAHLELIDLRNLVAHAKIEALTIDGSPAALMSVADVSTAMNARLVFEDRWDATIAAWRQAIDKALKDVRS